MRVTGGEGQVRLFTNAGALTDPRAEEGGYSASFLPPKEFFPHVAIVVARVKTLELTCRALNTALGSPLPDDVESVESVTATGDSKSARNAGATKPPKNGKNGKHGKNGKNGDSEKPEASKKKGAGKNAA